MNSLTIEQKKERLDDTFKVLLTIFTLLLSVVTAFYGRISPEWTASIFFYYGFTICSWGAAHLRGGKSEYLIKFISWVELLGGITQAIFMLYLGTLSLDLYYYTANWVIALIICCLVFWYVRSLLDEDGRKILKILLLAMIALSVVFPFMKFIGIF